MLITDPCRRCGLKPAMVGDWWHCDDCFQELAHEAHQALQEMEEQSADE
jgi:ribosomal protein S14